MFLHLLNIVDGRVCDARFKGKDARSEEDDNIMNYNSSELETMKRRIAANQSSIFSLAEIEAELKKRQAEKESFQK